MNDIIETIAFMEKNQKLQVIFDEEYKSICNLMKALSNKEGIGAGTWKLAWILVCIKEILI